jgi:polysaccharide export outer membrane protein
MHLKSNKLLLIVLLAALTSLMSCAGSGQMSQPVNEEVRAQQINNRTQARLTEEDYKIRPGDEVDIRVWQHDDFNFSGNVSAGGTINIPLVGEITVMNLTKSELEEVLKRRLANFIRDEISTTISVQNVEGLMVSVFGQVQRPDNYPVVDQLSIFRVLTTAGGPTQDANMRKVYLYRQSGTGDSLILDLTRYLEKGLVEEPEIMVRRGDIIYVTRKDNAIREMSEFLRDVVLLFGIFRIFN